MPVGYQVRVYDTTGAVQAVITRFRSLVIEHFVNIPSTLTLNLYSGDPAVQFFQLDSLVEVRRTYPEAGLDWYTEFIGFHRTPQFVISQGDQRIFTSYCRGLLDLIKRRSVRYYADTDGSAKDPMPADDAIKVYVNENAGPLATIANRRLTDGVTPGLSIAPMLGQGPTWSGAHAWDNLLETCKSIGETRHVDYDVKWLGGTNFEFRTYYPFQGTDRRVGTQNAVIFGVSQGNLTNPSHTVSRTDEITSVLVLGPGEGPLRDTTLVEAPPAVVNSSPWNKIEQDQNASSEDRLAALIAVGNEVLYEKRAAVTFTFEPLQTPRSSYGQHYFLGDLVTCTFDDIVTDVKIRAVTINLSEVRESMTFELIDPELQFFT